MKSKKRSRSGHGGGSASSSALVWTGQDHEDRNQRQLQRKNNKKMKRAAESGSGSGSSALPSASASVSSSVGVAVAEPSTQLANNNNNEQPQEPDVPSFAERKRAALTHETKEKRAAMQLRLHWIRTQKKVGALRARLTSWDPQDEHSIVVGLEECGQAGEGNSSADDDDAAPKKRKGRKGPESWKLRGPARPAHEVYDFDVRYVDPHRAALDGAHAKAKRTINALALYKGRVSALLLMSSPKEEGTPNCDDATLTPRLLSLLRQYLSFLMQYGHLSLELKRYKTAREAWLECVDLEGDPPPPPTVDNGGASGSHSGAGESCSVTTAREALVRMDLQQSPPRVESAWKFLSQRAGNDSSSWISYTRALLGCLLQRTDNEALVAEAIRSNVYCAYYLAFLDEFRSAMEYTEDLCEADDAPQTDLELALEYCADELLTKLWQSSGAATLLRRSISDAIAGQHDSLTPADVETNSRLERLQQELSKRGKHGHGPDDDAGAASATSDPPVDVEMYVGMFRTAVEMIQESGRLS